MNTLLDALENEYKLLAKKRSELTNEIRLISEKISAVSNTIISYGGQIPTTDNNEPYSLLSHNPITYSKDAPWRDKVLFALQTLNRPATADEISNFIHSQDNSKSLDAILSMVTQYCSKLFKSHELVLKGKEGKKNKYFFKTN